MTVLITEELISDSGNLGVPVAANLRAVTFSESLGSWQVFWRINIFRMGTDSDFVPCK